MYSLIAGEFELRYVTGAGKVLQSVGVRVLGLDEVYASPPPEDVGSEDEVVGVRVVDASTDPGNCNINCDAEFFYVRI